MGHDAPRTEVVDEGADARREGVRVTLEGHDPIEMIDKSAAAIPDAPFTVVIGDALEIDNKCPDVLPRLLRFAVVRRP